MEQKRPYFESKVKVSYKHAISYIRFILPRLTQFHSLPLSTTCVLFLKTCSYCQEGNYLLHRLNKNAILIPVSMYAYATTRLIFPSYLRHKYPTHVLLTFLVSTLNFLLSTPILLIILILNIKPLTI